MELQAAHQIIDTLAQGIHPVTGEAMPDDSPYNAPPVIRALFAVSQALQGKPARARRGLAAQCRQALGAGRRRQAGGGIRRRRGDASSWPLDLGRTPFAVETRLIKLGKLPPRMRPGVLRRARQAG